LAVGNIETVVDHNTVEVVDLDLTEEADRYYSDCTEQGAVDLDWDSDPRQGADKQQ